MLNVKLMSILPAVPYTLLWVIHPSATTNSLLHPGRQDDCPSCLRVKAGHTWTSGLGSNPSSPCCEVTVLPTAALNKTYESYFSNSEKSDSRMIIGSRAMSVIHFSSKFLFIYFFFWGGGVYTFFFFKSFFILQQCLQNETLDFCKTELKVKRPFFFAFFPLSLQRATQMKPNLCNVSRTRSSAGAWKPCANPQSQVSPHVQNVPFSSHSFIWERIFFSSSSAPCCTLSHSERNRSSPLYLRFHHLSDVLQVLFQTFSE